MNRIQSRAPVRIINSIAPIRICDNGGWTDTWFAGHGKIFNIAVYPFAEVQLEAYACDGMAPQVTIVAENFGHAYTRSLEQKGWDRHPLLEAAIERLGPPKNLSFRVTIFSEAPSGASTGTSAAVSVAMIGALDALRGGQLTPQEAADTAHAIETEMLGLQCGIQDQLCSAFGGINYIEMQRYPQATVTQLQIDEATAYELERRLVLIYLGNSHSSSQVHEQVIAGLSGAGPDCKALNALRRTAEKSRDAVLARRFDLLGEAMIENTNAQADLHPALISPEARRIIEVARAHGSIGWKVNGAGGNGGSVTLLCDAFADHKRALIREIEQEDERFQNIPIRLAAHGLSVYEASVTAKSLRAAEEVPAKTGAMARP